MACSEKFPDELLTILRRTRWRLDAKREFDGMSGGFYWDDELPDEVITTSLRLDNYAYRCVIGYRTSLIVGEPREELRGPWDQLLEECPEWPGFRPERRDPELLDATERANERFMASLRRMSKFWG